MGYKLVLSYFYYFFGIVNLYFKIYYYDAKIQPNIVIIGTFERFLSFNHIKYIV